MVFTRSSASAFWSGQGSRPSTRSKMVIGQSLSRFSGSVRPIHRQDQIIIFKVSGLNRPRFQAFKRIRRRSFDTARVRGITFVGGAGAGGFYFAGQALCSGELAKYRMGGGRSTDISKTDKQNFHQHGLVPELSCGSIRIL